jgi:alpha-2-macroglobulin-like protein
MKNSINKKLSLGIAAAALCLLGLELGTDGLRPASDNDFTLELKKKLSRLTSKNPEERVYVQTDRPFYAAGDNIWLSAWIRNGQGLRPSAQSDIVTVELINPKGAVERKINLIGRNGQASGDFALAPDAPGGLYKIRAYTDWMKNDGEDRCFTKEIQVQDVVLPTLKMHLEYAKKGYGPGDEVVADVDILTNEGKPLGAHAVRFSASLRGKELTSQTLSSDKEGRVTVRFTLPDKNLGRDGLLNVLVDYNGSTESISRSIPISTNELKVSFFPEGGDLVNGISSRVAFRALDEFGKGADVEGELHEEGGALVARFSSLHKGMGSFAFTPQAHKRYYMTVVRPRNVNVKYFLPEALERGYVMEVHKGQDAATVKVGSTESTEMTVVAQMRGKILYSTVLPVIRGDNTFSFATDRFPMGVLQVTLFDKRGIERAERLLFVNPHKQLSVSVKADKQKYLPREKVRLDVMVKDEDGLPAPALLSMSVVNDQLLSFADDRSGSLVSHLLLQDDIREKIEEPDFYFRKSEGKAPAALDLLMMTAGWRRFTWEKVLDDQEPDLKYEARKAILSGVIRDANTQKPLHNVKLSAGGKKWTTDSTGSFSIRDLELYDPALFQIERQGYFTQQQHVNDYSSGIVWYLYPAMQNHHGWNKHSRAKMDMEEAVPEMAMQFAAAGMAAPQAVENKAIKPMKHKALLAAPRVNRAVRQGELAIAREDRLWDADDSVREQEGQQGAGYHRARVFAAPVYDKQQEVTERTDFRNTIYWNPRLEIGHNGKRTIEFYASDDITSFRAVVEGLAADGTAGRGEAEFFTQLPFALLTKVPSHLIGNDVVHLPVTLKNNTSKPLGGSFTLALPAQLELLSKPAEAQTIMPGVARTIYLDCRVRQCSVDTVVKIGFSACALRDEITVEVKIRPRGFPVSRSFSGQHAEKEYDFETREVVPGSLRISVNAFPDVVSDLMTGVEGILREPYGCFEQTSCTAYPNAMALQYMKHSGSGDSRALARANDLLDRGYKRLTTFETPTKGYEWFGSTPAHEGLTAYGIMEFADMKRAGQNIDEQMLDRTARWLMMHRDGKGGFERERRALHDFGRISDEVMNGYIVYALSDAGYKDIEREFETSHKKALASGDAYLLALSANAALSLGKTRECSQALTSLLKLQSPDGSFTGSSHSITYSQGRSLTIETTALAVMALLQSGDADPAHLAKAVKALISMRDGSGTFSSTQGTILALKALTAYAIYNKKAKEDGVLVVYVDGHRVAEQAYKAGERGTVTIRDIEKFVTREGRHTLKVKFSGTRSPLPHSVSVNWSTTLPASADSCALGLVTSVTGREVHTGETVRLNITLTNKRKRDVPSAMAIIGIPAGLSVQPWQLKELQEKKVFDFYEISGDKLSLYYRGMGASDVREIALDLKAEVPGEFNFPASCVYLYYTNEHKSWCSAGKIKVNKTAGS